ncbi:MAG TPA: DUF1330 domain-containing protein [Herpetosiphonaceae bacterium]
MAAYWFFDILEIIDPAAMEEYRARVVATVTQSGGRYLIIGGPATVVEGDWQPVFPVLIEFPSREQAQRWYDSTEYRELKALRQAATRGNVVFLEGTTLE